MKRSQLDAEMEALRSSALSTMMKMASLCDNFVGNPAEKRYLRKISQDLKSLIHRMSQLKRATPLYDLSDPDLLPPKPIKRREAKKLDG